jgi:uncharacterized protein (DUF697 family)
MTRKKLPRAIMQMRVDLPEIAAVADEEVARPPTTWRHAATVRPAATISALPLSKRASPAASGDTEPQAAERRARAQKIVERHRLYAAMGGLIPLPVVNVAGVTTIVLRMVKQLSDLYEVPFKRERTRSIIVALMGGSVPTGLAAAAASTLVFVVPGAGLAGLAVSSLTAAALTRGIGLIFVDHFENGAMAPNAAEPEMAPAF